MKSVTNHSGEMAACHTILQFSLWALILVSSIVSIPSHDFRQGESETVLFQHTLSHDNSSFEYELFTLDSTLPFHTSGYLRPENLKTGQRDRFFVEIVKERRTVIIVLRILDVEVQDGGIYILSLRENTDGFFKNYIFDADIKVIVPSGPADCAIQPRPRGSSFREVHCRAAVGSHGGGKLVCYQNSITLPVLAYSAETELTATFRMTTGSGINCCSHLTQDDVPSISCTDFVFEELEMHSDNPSSTTNHDQITENMGKVTKINGLETEIYEYSGESRTYALRGDSVMTILIGIFLSILYTLYY